MQLLSIVNAMTYNHLIAAIFIIIYMLIAIQRIPGLRIDRPSGVTIGVTLLVGVGFISLPEAYSYVDWDVITFLLGIMVMVAYLEHSGFFGWIALWLMRSSRSSSQLLFFTIMLAGLLSAFFVNDTVCLLFTPILIHTASYLRLNPLPYLIGLATASNVGSALTITGNPQNMYIGIQSGIHYLAFMGIMLVPVLAGLLLNYLTVRLLFSHQISQHPLPRPTLEIPPLNKPLMLKTLAALGFTLALFSYGVAYPLASLTGMALILVLGYVPPASVFQRVNWTLLLFFAGMFVVMGAFEKAGYTEGLMIYTREHFADMHLSDMLGLAAVTTLLSNAVSNVPAVMLLHPLILDLGGGQKLWMLLAMASTFAGNLTLIGSAANLIVAEKALEHDIYVSFWSYLKVGLPLTGITLLMGVLWLHWLL